VQQGIHALDTRPERVRPRVAGWIVLALVLLVAAVLAAGIVAAGRSGQSVASIAARARQSGAATSLLAGPPASVSAGAARLLLVSAPAAVVASAASRADVTQAAAIAGRAHAPLLLIPAGSSGGPQAAALRAEIRALHPIAVLAVGVARQTVSAELPGINVVTRARALPLTTAAEPLRRVVVLVHGATSITAIAIATTARVAGAHVLDLGDYDPMVDPAAIRALAAAKPLRVLAIGSGFGSAALLAARVAVAETGVQLPGGGQVLFPVRRIIALYGNPQYPALGALGQQDLTASVARARAVAAQYQTLSRVPVVPGFEIIATVAAATPGPTGSYSYETPLAVLRPWVDAATAAGMYVILDLQAGRDSLLAQAEHYRSLLKLPNVGLALDPEWKLQPGQLPLRQIGSVSITEVNSVVTWLARLTARYRLPQKLLELHEFRLSMIQNEAQLDTRHSDLAIVINMDGQGAPASKDQTWAAIISAAPKGVFFGWKDFYVKDTPMMDPQQTMDRSPRPVLISYQ
jgi:hypothetical protein